MCLIAISVEEQQNAANGTHSLPSRGPKRGKNCYLTPAFSRVPNKGDKITSGYLNPALSWAHRRTELLRNLHTLRGSQQRGQNYKWLPLPSRGPKRERNCYLTPAFLRVPNKGDKMTSGHLNIAFFGAHKRADMLRNPCILRGSQQRGQNETWLPHPCLLEAPKESKSAT